MPFYMYTDLYTILSQDSYDHPVDLKFMDRKRTGTGRIYIFLEGGELWCDYTVKTKSTRKHGEK